MDKAGHQQLDKTSFSIKKNLYHGDQNTNAFHFTLQLYNLLAKYHPLKSPQVIFFFFFFFTEIKAGNKHQCYYVFKTCCFFIVQSPGWEYVLDQMIVLSRWR